jgi:hypothetical protein
MSNKEKKKVGRDKGYSTYRCSEEYHHSDVFKHRAPLEERMKERKIAE